MTAVPARAVPWYRPAVLALLAAAAAAGCARPLRTGADRGVDLAASDSAPTVRVRSYWNSSHFTVVAWSAEEPRVGLRADLRRDDGTISGAPRRGDHVLFVEQSYAAIMGGFLRASLRGSKELLLVGGGRDDQACWNAHRGQCSPLYSARLGVADSVLRSPAARDSVTVDFYSDWAKPWHVTVPGAVVTAYLRTVDSVAAARRAQMVGAR